MKKKFRLSVFVYPQIQIILISLPIIFGAALFVFMAKSVNSVFEILSRDALDLGLSPDHPFLQTLNDHKNTLLLNLSAMGLLGGSVVAIFMLIFSHRFLGPIMRLKSFFRNYQKGEHLKFRRGDYFAELAEEINKVLETDKEI